MGVSPWTAAPPTTQSPEGTTGAMFPIAPLGLRMRGTPRNHGLTPMATKCRPVGTKTKSTTASSQFATASSQFVTVPFHFVTA